MIINHNMSAEFANRYLGIRTGALDKDIEKLSSGLAINRAGDNASGLAVATKMDSQVRGLNQASKNTQDGISFIQTTEGYLQETQDALERIRELAVQEANGIYSSDDRDQVQVEVTQMVDEVDRVASHAQFNGMNLLTGRFAANGPVSMWIHVGANMDQRVRLDIGTMTSAALGIRDASSPAPTAATAPAPAAAPAGGQPATPAPAPAAPAAAPASANGMANGTVSVLTAGDANMTIGRIDEALKKVVKQRANLGAYQNRLSMTMRGLDIGAENLLAAQSRIQDTDMARQMSDFVKNQILIQSSSAMVAQANQKNQAVLRLLG